MSADESVLSSKDMPGGTFAPHGEFRVRYRDGLMLWENLGPFNLEAMLRYGKLRDAARARWLRPDQWVAGVVHWQGSALMSPEAFEAYRLGLERALSQTHRIAAVAWVSDPDLEGMDFMRGRFVRLFEAHGLPLQEFADQAEAEAWARALLAARG